MAAQTSSGVPLTRARLENALAGLPVRAGYTARYWPFCWSVAHEVDGRRQFHPYNRMDEIEFAALRGPGMEEAAQALAQAGYHVLVRHVPDAVQLAELPASLQAQFADTAPLLQVWIVPDDVPEQAADSVKTGNPRLP